MTPRHPHTPAGSAHLDRLVRVAVGASDDLVSVEAEPLYHAGAVHLTARRRADGRIVSRILTGLTTADELRDYLGELVGRLAREESRP